MLQGGVAAAEGGWQLAGPVCRRVVTRSVSQYFTIEGTVCSMVLYQQASILHTRAPVMDIWC